MKSTTISGSRVEMKCRFKSVCRVCKGTVYVGDTAYWFPLTQKVEHYNCARRKNR